MNKTAFIILFVFMIVVFGILGYLLYQSSLSNKALLDAISQSKKQTISPAVSQSSTSSSLTSAPLTKTTTYSDSRLKGFSFDYDSDVWEIKKLEAEEKYTRGSMKYQGPGIICIEKKGDGALSFVFTLAFGMGGGTTPFKKNEVIILKNGWARLQGTSYGLAKNLVYYKDKPDDLENAKKYCDEVKKGTDGYPLFDSSLCPEIENGTIIGYAPQPTFSRSAKYSRAVDLSVINASWAQDTYVKETGIDDGNIIVITSYRGTNPQLADKLVEQLNSQ